MLPPDVNPYASPVSAIDESEARHPPILNWIRPPATALLLLSALSLLYAALFVPLYVANLIWSPGPDPEEPSVWFFALAVACVPSNAIVFVGAWNMRRARRYRLSVAAAILGCTPGLSPLFYIGIPFGIWALIILIRKSAKERFRRVVTEARQAAPTPPQS